MAKKKGKHLSAPRPQNPQVLNPTAVRSVTSVSMQQVTMQGPLPPPPMLRQYEQIYPGFTERWLSAIEEQGRHRRSMDEPTLQLNFRLMRSGQIIGGVVCLAALGCGTYLVTLGNSPIGVTLMFAAIAPMVVPFLRRLTKGGPPTS